MRVLFITNELPCFTGGGMPIRDYHLIKNLGREHQITLACFTDPSLRDTAEKYAALQGYCQEIVTVSRATSSIKTRWQARLASLESMLHPTPWNVRALTPRGLRAQVQALLQTQRFDIVHVNHVEMGPLLAATGTAKRVLGIEVISPKIKRLWYTQVGRARRFVYYVEWKKLARYERTLYQQVDLCTMASAVEKETVLAMAPQSTVTVIPNGVDCGFFSPLLDRAAAPAGDMLLFTGSMAYPPNHDAVLYFQHEVWPLLKCRLPHVRWQIVGRDPPRDLLALASADIEVTGRVADVRPYMENCRALIVPLRSGGGTRIKILEALAAGLPVVSTTIGAEGLDLVHGEHILLADTPEQFAAAVARLLTDPGLEQRLRTRGRKIVEERYDWRAIASQLDAAYRDLLDQERRTAAD